MRRLLFALVLICLALPGRAQEMATLIADTLSIRGNDVLVATGNVEVFFEGNTLRASEVIYDRTADRLRIAGPIRIIDANGDVILADQGDLSADLTEGILTSARLVLDQQLQLSAAELVRVGGRYTALNRVAASSCKVCAGNSPPLWEIRARRVVHDQQEKQLYFEHAQFRLGGLPVFYIPRLRIPDPTLTRATGFLLPDVRSSTALGFGLKVPYFIRIGDNRDLLVTPYITTKGGRSVEFRYRQTFRTGTITLTTALARDDLRTDQARGYLKLEGGFLLPRGYKLQFSGIVVSDRGYLSDYGISDQDRLNSTIDLTRVKRNLYFSAKFTSIRTLRDGESLATQPSLVGDLTLHRRFRPAVLGGTGGFQFQTHNHYRASTSGVDGDGDGIADGRDLGRVSIKGDWRRNWSGPFGLQFTAMAEATTDFYSIGQDDAFAGTPHRTTGAAAVELRWPLVKTGRGGVSQLIEPVVQVVYAPRGSDPIPNEDSILVELDESSLFTLDRLPGSDAVERGPRLNLGVNYLRTDPDGWTLGVTAGRVLRQEEDAGQFGDASGLGGVTSDWLLTTQLQASGLALTNRMLLDDDLTLAKGELRLDFNRNRYYVAAGYAY
ncbi:MAG: LPS-assembly protein LptD, partial [Paracoccaceae bacterium]